MVYSHVWLPWSGSSSNHWGGWLGRVAPSGSQGSFFSFQTSKNNLFAPNSVNAAVPVNYYHYYYYYYLLINISIPKNGTGCSSLDEPVRQCELEIVLEAQPRVNFFSFF